MSLVAFNIATFSILELETVPPKFSDLTGRKLVRTMAPVNKTIDAVLNKAVGIEKKEQAFFFIYQLKRIFPNLKHIAK